MVRFYQKEMIFFTCPHCQKEAISYLEMAYTPFIYSSKKQCSRCGEGIKFNLSAFALNTAASFILFAPLIYFTVTLLSDYAIFILLSLLPFLFVFQLWLSPMILGKFGLKIFRSN